MPPNCSASVNLSFNLNEAFLTINITSLRGTPVSCPASTVHPIPLALGVIEAAFRPSNGTVPSYPGECNYDKLDWQQVITHAPPLPGPKPLMPQYVSANILDGKPDEHCADMSGVTWNSDCSVFVEGTAPLLYDPPPGGDANVKTAEANSYPFYYPWSKWGYFDDYCVSVTDPSACISGLPGIGVLPTVLSPDGTTMWFADRPHNDNLPGVQASASPSPNEYLAFETRLVGLSTEQIPGSVPCGPNNNEYVASPQYFCSIVHSFSWNSTFNGQACTLPPDQHNHCPGVTIPAEDGAVSPIIPGTGTGGATITGIDGVTLPPSVLATDLTITASGLSYSRVSQTFDGTLSIKNTSGATMIGPLQIFLFGLPPNVNLVNQSANLSGTPYLTVPIAEGLAPGASVSVPVQFKNPANATISLQPTVYAGTIQ